MTSDEALFFLITQTGEGEAGEKKKQKRKLPATVLSTLSTRREETRLHFTCFSFPLPGEIICQTAETTVTSALATAVSTFCQVLTFVDWHAILLSLDDETKEQRRRRPMKLERRGKHECALLATSTENISHSFRVWDSRRREKCIERERASKKMDS